MVSFSWFGSFQRWLSGLLFAWWLLGGRLESVAAPVDRDNLGVMKQAVEYRAGGGHIAEQFAYSSTGRLEVIMVERFS